MNPRRSTRRQELGPAITLDADRRGHGRDLGRSRRHGRGCGWVSSAAHSAVSAARGSRGSLAHRCVRAVARSSRVVRRLRPATRRTLPRLAHPRRARVLGVRGAGAPASGVRPQRSVGRPRRRSPRARRGPLVAPTARVPRLPRRGLRGTFCRPWAPDSPSPSRATRAWRASPPSRSPSSRSSASASPEPPIWLRLRSS